MTEPSKLKKLVHQHSTADPDFWIASTHDATDRCLKYSVDTYGGIIFDSSVLPEDIDSFRTILSHSLEHLIHIGFNRGYWIRIPVEYIDLVPVCIKEYGFRLHHARRSYVMLVKWSHPSFTDPIPDSSYHQVGVGCVVVREDGYVLLVKEKSGPAAVKGGIWKLPTGLAEPTEDIGAAAIREAKEETGIDCVFDSIITIRHSHGGSPTLGARSDLFFACLLRPSIKDQEFVLQEAEIVAAKWVHYGELSSVTECGEGTAAKRLMDVVADAAAGKLTAAIRGCKLPAWRRANCDQWVYYPMSVTAEDNVCDFLSKGINN